MSSAVMNSKVSAMDTSVLSVNRNKLMKLAEGIKTKKKPNHKNKSLNFKKDPGYTNIEHLVFGTYRPRPSLSSPTTSVTSPTQLQPATNGCPPTPPESRVQLSPGTFHGAPKRNSGTNGFHEHANVPNHKNGSSCIRQNVPGHTRNVGGSCDLEAPDRNTEVRSVNHNVNCAAPGMEPSRRATGNSSAPLGSEIPLFCPAGPEMHRGFTEAPRLPLGSTNAVMSRLLDGSVHSPPVHLLTHGKYLTREFSADFGSPDAPEQLDSPSLERRPRTIYKTDCCMPRSSGEVQSCRGTPSPKLPGSAPRSPPVASRASTKARSKKEVPPPYWSFRGGKPPASKAGPLRSASLCAANKAVKVDARTPLPSDGEELQDTKAKRPPSFSSELPVSKKVSSRGPSEIPVAKKSNPPKWVPNNRRDRPILRPPAQKSADGDAVEDRICAPLATSVQTMRKVSVSAANPAWPTVSTKVKIVMAAESDAEVNNNSSTRGSAGNLTKTRCSTRASFAGSGGNLTAAKLRSASRTSLPGCRTANPPRTERPKACVSPIGVGNFSSRNRSTSACSLAVSHRLGSSCSLGGSQCSLYSNQGRRPATASRIDTGIRHSFHAGGATPAPTRGSPARSIPTGRTSLRAAPVSAKKPPVCPGNPVGKPSPATPKDRLSGTIATRMKQPRNGATRIQGPRTGVAKGKGSGQRAAFETATQANGTAASSETGSPASPDDEESRVAIDASLACNDATVANDQGVVDGDAVSEISKDVMQLHKFLIEAFQGDVALRDTQAGDSVPSMIALHNETAETEAQPESINSQAVSKEPDSPHAETVPLIGSPEREAVRLDEVPVGDSSAEVVAEVVRPVEETCLSGLPPVPRAIRRTISLPRTCFPQQWSTPPPHPSRRSLPSRSLSLAGAAATELQVSLSGRYEPAPRKELSLPRTNDHFTPPAPAFEPVEPVDAEKVPLSSDTHVVANVDVDSSHTVEGRQITEDGSARALSSRDSGCILETPPLASPEKLKPTVPKCVRRIKAASSPVFTDGRVDAWVSESDLHRPWSQLCSEKDVERLVQAKSCALSAGSMAAGIESIVQMNPSADAVSGTVHTSPTSSQNNLFARFSSMRTPSTRPPGSPVEGVLQKFRKSFSARFYKKVKGESPPSPSSSATKAARHASFSSYLDDGSCDADLTMTHNGSLNASSISDVSIDSAEGETIFRLGPIVWRSSKERKEKSRKLKKADSKGGESVTVETGDGHSICSIKHEVESEINSSCHSTPTNMAGYHRPNTYLKCNHLSPQVLRRRSQSTTLHPERLKRPLSDQGSSIHGSIVLANPRPNSRNGVHVANGNPSPARHAHNGTMGPVMRLSSSDVSSLQSMPIIRRERRTHGLRWSKGRSNLRRSVSQPLEMEKLDGMGTLSHSPGGLSDQEDLNHNLSNASSDEEISSANGDGDRHHIHKNNRHLLESVEPVLYAEALWDHVTMDPEELAFKAGDLIEVLDVSDGEWWWGINGNHIGWLPASFVRPRVNQEDTVEECVANMGNGTLHRQNPRKMSISMLSNDQVRTNVIKEIVFTERDFVRHLEDVCEGYLKQMRKRIDMFPEERINTIFGNVEQLYAFQSKFVAKLEQCIDWDHPYLSQIGSCFTEHREGFEMYSEYCNNHPQAVGELQELYTNPKFAHFFEACRLLQEMIDISLDGFLLTPVQKICKYPLQLAELLKYTKPDHPDYKCVAEALDTMRNVAHYINERKRRMECLEKLAAWQMTVEYWEGPDLLDHSSELIYSGEASKVTAAWSRDFTLFLFDHQLIICKKDLLKRNSYSYKGHIDTDTCEFKDIPDGKDTHFGLTLKNAWKLYCKDRGKWVIFATRTAEEKQKWMKAFEDERWRVDEDQLQGFVVTDKARKSAVMAVQSRKKPKRPKDKENKNLSRRLTHPDAYVVSTKSGSLPLNVVLTTNKKKTSSGWFHFGSNKKTKR